MGANPVVPDAVSLVRDLDIVDAVLDQGETASCVAHACAGAVRLRHALQCRAIRLVSVPMPSRRWCYRLARETHHEGDVDEGTFISSAFYIMRTLGWPDERQCPWTPARINDAMAVDVRRHAYDQRDAVSEYAITAWGDARISAIKSALSMGYPVVFGAKVDEAFLSCTGWTKQELTGASLGGHAMILCGYDSDGAHVLNSWGHDWGVGGLGLLSWGAVSHRIRDLRVVTLTKEPTT